MAANTTVTKQDTSESLKIELTEFLNLYPYRAPHIMWFLGAGASVTSGLPTAGTLIWEFKREIYCNSQHISSSRFKDLGDSRFRTTVQSHFDSQGGFPKLNAPEEYSFYFEKYLPDERDRQRFLSERLKSKTPSFGYYCLAAIHAMNQSKIIWSTNFDRLVEQSFQETTISEKLPRELTVASLEQPDKALCSIQDQQWPMLIKLHGDYQYHKLANIESELLKQDAILEQCLVNQSTQHGIAFVGYSGRDSSVMKMLYRALDQDGAFPHGIFWFTRLGSKPAEEVLNFLSQARAKQIQAAYVEVGGFDELMSDLFLPHEATLPAIKDLVRDKQERRRSLEPIYKNSKRFPVLRSNALEIKSYPSTCTKFEANIGGTRDVRQIVRQNPCRICAGRRKSGVIAFGTREDLTHSFQGYNPTAFDRHPIESRRLRYDSQEWGLLYHALIEGIAQQTGLARSKNRKGRLLYFPKSAILSDQETQTLKGITGKAPVRRRGADGYVTHEAIEVSVDFCDQRLWVFFEPTLMITTDGIEPYLESDRSQIGREDIVKRYNREANSLLDFWIAFVSSRSGGGGRGSDWHVYFPSKDEAEATFQISTTTAFGRQK